MIATASMLVLALAGPPEDPPASASEPLDVVTIEPAPLPVREAASPEPSPPIEPEPAKLEAPTPAEPTPAEPTPAEPTRTWQVEIFADINYGVSSNQPDNHVFRGMVPSPRTGEISPNMVGAFIRHQASEDEPWWFELGLHAGPAIDALVAADPTPGGVDSQYAGVEVFKHIALANLGVRIRKSKTSIGAGVFESPIGLSSFWTFRNPNYTPMWQGNATPYYLVGARVTQEIPGGVTLSGWLTNGFQTYADANRAPSGVVSLAYSPAPRKGMQALTLTTTGYFGPEGLSIAPEDWLVLSNTMLTWDFDSHFAMAAVWDVAIENPGRPKAEQNFYTGGGLLARGTLFENHMARLDLVLRPDVVWDRDGRFLGVPQWLFTPTATLNLTLWDHLMLRAEYRFDQSSSSTGFFYRGAATTVSGAGLAQRQHTVFFALTGLWDFWFGRQGKPASSQ